MARGDRHGTLQAVLEPSTGMLRQGESVRGFYIPLPDTGHTYLDIYRWHRICLGLDENGNDNDSH